MKVTKNLRRVSGDSLPYPSPGTVSIKRESDDGVADDEVSDGIRNQDADPSQHVTDDDTLFDNYDSGEEKKTAGEKQSRCGEMQEQKEEGDRKALQRERECSCAKSEVQGGHSEA